MSAPRLQTSAILGVVIMPDDPASFTCRMTLSHLATHERDAKTRGLREVHHLESGGHSGTIEDKLVEDVLDILRRLAYMLWADELELKRRQTGSLCGN